MLGAAMARRASVYRIMMVNKFVSEDVINCCIQKFYAMTVGEKKAIFGFDKKIILSLFFLDTTYNSYCTS